MPALSLSRLFAVMLLLTRAAAAQLNDTCRPGAASNEAKTMAIFDVPLAFSGAVAPDGGHPGRVVLGVEAAYLPNVDPAVATPTVCRPDKHGPEHTDLIFASPRPRLWVTLPAGFALEASWLPPVRLGDVKGNLVGVALARGFAVGPAGTLLRIRAHGSFGKVEAPITCDDAALQDAGSPCYQGTRSNDSFQPNVFGAEAAVGWRLGARLRPYVGAGVNRLMPRFRVNFTNSFAVVDHRRVVVDLTRLALFAGATWSAGSRLDFSGELYAAPTDAITGRVTGRVRLR